MPRQERNGDVETGGRLNNNDDSLDHNNRTPVDLESQSRDLGDRASDEAPSSFFPGYEDESRVEDFADPLREANQGAFTPRGPRGYRRSDSSIREDIAEYLSQDGQIDAAQIQVSVEDGEVLLTGTTATREEKRLAEIVAEQCAGVKSVRNELRVNQTDLSQKGDRQDHENRDDEWEQLQEAPLSTARAN